MKIKDLFIVLLIFSILNICNACVETKSTPPKNIEFNSPAEILIEVDCKAVRGEASSSCCNSIRPIFLYIERTAIGIRVTEKGRYIKRMEIIKLQGDVKDEKQENSRDNKPKDEKEGRGV